MTTYAKGRHRKRHRKNKWAREYLRWLELGVAIRCYNAESAHIKATGEFWINSTYICTCPPMTRHKEVWK